MKLAEHPRPWKAYSLNGWSIIDANGKTVIGNEAAMSQKTADHIVHCVNSQAVRDR